MSRARVVSAATFSALPSEYQELIVNGHTGIQDDEAEAQLPLVARILHFMTGQRIRLAVAQGMPSAGDAVGVHAGGSHIDAEITSTQPLSREADVLIDTNTLKRHYCVLKTLAANVEMVQSSVDNVMLAVKRLPHSLDSAKQMRRNYQEVRFLKYCSGHPNIVSFVRCNMYRDELWLAMEYLQGGTLDMALGLYAFKERQLAYMVRHIATGLAFLHAAGICHRALAPRHIGLDLHGNVKILDFSSAVDVSAGSRPNQAPLAGIPHSATPEVLTAEAFDEKVDVWALGSVLVALVNGKEPESSVASMFYLASDREKGAPRVVVERRMSVDFHSFIDSALTYSPHLRPSAARLLRHPWLTKTLAKRREMIELVHYLRYLISRDDRRRIGESDEVVIEMREYMEQAEGALDADITPSSS